MSDMYADFAKQVGGLFVGQLTDEERDQLSECVKRGYARVVYRGVAGFMGVGKIESAGATKP